MCPCDVNWPKFQRLQYRYRQTFCEHCLWAKERKINRFSQPDTSKNFHTDTAIICSQNLDDTSIYQHFTQVSDRSLLLDDDGDLTEHQLMDKKNEEEEKLILQTASATWHRSVAAAQQRFKVLRIPTSNLICHPPGDMKYFVQTLSHPHCPQKNSSGNGSKWTSGSRRHRSIAAGVKSF